MTTVNRTNNTTEEPELYFRKKTFEFTSSVGESSSYNLNLPISNNTTHKWKVTVSETLRLGSSHTFLTLEGIRNLGSNEEDDEYAKGYCKVEILDFNRKVIYSHEETTDEPSHSSFTLINFCNLTTLERDHPQFYNKIITFRITIGMCYEYYNPKTFDSHKKMLDEEILTDVVIKTKERQFKCHKFILASESDYFRAMFESKLKESLDNEVDWTNVFNANTVSDLLYFLYTGMMPPTIERTWLTLIEASDMCLLPSLKNMCEFTMLQIINVNNAVDILKAAEKYGSEADELHLKKSTVDFIIVNYPEIEETTAWKDMEPDMAKRLMPTVFKIMYSKRA